MTDVTVGASGNNKQQNPAFLNKISFPTDAGKATAGIPSDHNHPITNRNNQP